MSHTNSHVEVLTEIRDLVDQLITEAKEATSEAESQPVGTGSIGSGVQFPPAVAPTKGVTEADRAIFSHISSKIGTIQGTFGMFHDAEMGRMAALAQGKRLLDDVMIALFANPQAHFDEIRELIVKVDLAKEIDLNRGQGDLLQKAKTKADDHLSNVVEGDTDVTGDMTGVVGGG